jgi:hypothetical protein
MREFNDSIIEDFKKNPFKKAKKGMKDPLKEINKSFKKIEKFFKDFENFFKKLKKAFTFTQQKLIAVLTTIVIPFFGQMFARISYLNGSLDKPWLLLFGIPPLTLLPAFFMMFDLIKKGKGGKPWDKYIFIPIIVNIISTFVIDKYYANNMQGQIIKYIILLLSFVFIYWLRSKKICKSKSAKISKILSDSLITYSLMEVMTIVLQYVPLIGVGLKVIERVIPFGSIFLDMIGIFSIYVITNMINGSNKKYCKETKKSKFIFTLIIISIVITFTKKFKK